MSDKEELKEAVTAVLKEKIRPAKIIYDLPLKILLFSSSGLLVDYLLGRISEKEFDDAYSIVEKATRGKLKDPSSLESYLTKHREIVYHALKEISKMKGKK
ncbi:MAG: hypothetical protein QMD12_01245 [Candidatus Aenigmarchaeota archaeon]|nr:hypothetical protein [Candidatus Aenigmarchaeota archaeon]